MAGPAAGYSGTPLPAKLGIKAGARVLFVNAPDDFAATLGALPDGVAVRRQARGPLDVIVLFALSHGELKRGFRRLQPAMAVAGRLWIAWPKRSSGVSTDLTEAVVRDTGLATGLVDNKVCAIDHTWSGLQFVIRLADRPRGA